MAQQEQLEKLPRIKTKKTSYTFDYPQALEYAALQNSVFWLADEIKVEKDIQDLKVNATIPEQHATTTALKLFTKYELIIGAEFWGEVIMKMFPRPDIQRMANCFSYFELNVHAPFYAKINEVLGIATDEFYNSYVEDPVLKERIDFLDEMLESGNDLLSLAAFSFIEGSVLYSSFAFLKHFQANGKNLNVNICRGVNFSNRDENIHAEAGAWLFKTLLSELNLSEEVKATLKETILQIAHKVFEHEARIIAMFFEKGPIDGITETQLLHFAQSRVNICLQNLGYEKLFEVKYNPIADWFYDNINNFQFNDFFSGVGASYNRNWSEAGFTWKTESEQ
jgi:ribonucleotide reductase beta subunit family protein with ferritin-like domain